MRPDEKVANALERLKRRAQRAKPLELKAWIDGDDISGKYLLFEAVNIPYVGPNLFLAPDSKPGDGHCRGRARHRGRARAAGEVPGNLAENRERLAVLPSHRGKSLKLEWTGFEIHIDDKLWPQRNDEPRDRRRAWRPT